MKKQRLSEQQKQLLSECCQYSIYDDYSRKEYYRLGGHGLVPMRYDGNRLYKLRELGLVENNRGCWEATPLGKQTDKELNT